MTLCGLFVIDLLPSVFVMTVAFSPDLPLTALFCWRFLRPNFVPLVSIVGLSLVVDILIFDHVFGLQLIVFMTMTACADAARRLPLVADSRAGTFAFFTMAAALCSLIDWGGNSLAFGAPLAVEHSLLSFLATVALYPLVIWIVEAIHRLLP